MTNITQGWNCIEEAFQEVYPEQTNPFHFGTLVPYMLGGNDPLDGISIYDGGDFFHFVTFGFSELYEKESENKEYSGFGFELTVKLKKTLNVDESELRCMAGILQDLARYVFKSGNVFLPYEYIYTKQQEGMDSKRNSKLTGFATVPENLIPTIDTPNGKVDFVQLIGLTDKELKAIYNKEHSVSEIIDKLKHTLTDYTRIDII